MRENHAYYGAAVAGSPVVIFNVHRGLCDIGEEAFGAVEVEGTKRQNRKRQHKAEIKQKRRPQTTAKTKQKAESRKQKSNKSRDEG